MKPSKNINADEWTNNLINSWEIFNRPTSITDSEKEFAERVLKRMNCETDSEFAIQLDIAPQQMESFIINSKRQYDSSLEDEYYFINIKPEEDVDFKIEANIDLSLHPMFVAPTDITETESFIANSITSQIKKDRIVKLIVEVPIDLYINHIIHMTRIADSN